MNTTDTLLTELVLFEIGEHEGTYISAPEGVEDIDSQLDISEIKRHLGAPGVRKTENGWSVEILGHYRRDICVGQTMGSWYDPPEPVFERCDVEIEYYAEFSDGQCVLGEGHIYVN